MKRLSLIQKLTAAALLVVFTLLTPVILGQPANAQSPQEKALCEGSGGVWDPNTNGGSCSTPGSNRTVPGTIRRVIQIFIFIVGAVAVLMIVIGGLRYTLSAGDEKSAAAGKNTLIFAVVGLIITFAAYAIVNFVLDALGA